MLTEMPDAEVIATLKAEIAELKKNVNIQKAHSALRGRILQEIRDKIGPLVVSLEDEGDRIYLGSTNDKDWLTEIEETIFEIDDEVWATLNREEADPYQDLYDLRVNKVPALQARVAVLDETLKPFAEMADSWSESEPDETMMDYHEEDGAHINLGHCRAARAALQGGSNG
jgi:hypothetical protein